MDAQMDRVFKALADATRRQLLDRLYAQTGQTLGQLCEGLSLSRQAVTKHLRLLEAAELVVIHWRGREKLHFLNPLPIHALAARWIHKYEQPRLDALLALKHNLENLEETPHEPENPHGNSP